jgi:hypothetical protein
MLANRYDSYLKEGFVNDTTSQDAPLFCTQRANATVGFISSMLLLYHEAPNSRFNDELDRVKNRNFVLIRLNNGFDAPPFDGSYPENGFTFYDDTAWVEQIPDDGLNGRPLCPDCKGKGLAALKSTVADTRSIRVDATHYYRPPVKALSQPSEPISSDTATAPVVDISNETIIDSVAQDTSSIAWLKKHPYRYGIAASFLVVCIGIGAVLSLQHNINYAEDVALFDTPTATAAVATNDADVGEALSSNSTVPNTSTPSAGYAEQAPVAMEDAETTVSAVTEESTDHAMAEPAIPADHFVVTLEPNPGTGPWTDVNVDGEDRVVYGLLHEKRDIEVTQSCTIRTGQPSNLTVKRNGLPIDWVIGSDGTGSLTLDITEG